MDAVYYDDVILQDVTPLVISSMRLEWQVRLASCRHRYRSPALAFDQPYIVSNRP